MRIYLIGFPGSGKTYVGRRLAAKMQLRFIDLDDLIESNEQQQIPDIFEQKGEDYFRKAERNALLETTEIDNLIISAGGGTPCFFDNLQIMKNAGVVIFLEAPVPVLATRLALEPDKRPLVKNTPGIAKYIEQTLEKRLPFYERADFVFHPSTAPNSIDELARYLKRFIS